MTVIWIGSILYYRAHIVHDPFLLTSATRYSGMQRPITMLAFLIDHGFGFRTPRNPRNITSCPFQNMFLPTLVWTGCIITVPCDVACSYHTVWWPSFCGTAMLLLFLGIRVQYCTLVNHSLGSPSSAFSSLPVTRRLGGDVW